ncbi:MAG: cadherin-like beta sandwich domain-containing protein [Verrucomicrobiota bacterium]
MAPAKDDLIHPTYPERFQGLFFRTRKASALASHTHLAEARAPGLMAIVIVFFALFLCIPGSATAATVKAHFTSASSVPVTATGYTAKGNDIDLSLGFAPATGNDLTVVRNTGLPFITGRFGNLRQGEEIGLNHGGIIYNFVANYFGGSGNDLVLVWQRRVVYSWGGNGHGQLGDGSATLRRLPVAVSATGVLSGKTVIALAGGKHHSVALCSEGTVVAWGDNGFGQLGNGSTVESKIPSPVADTGILSGKTVVGVAAGKFHTLALCADGSVASWGNNTRGQLGNRSAIGSNVPVSVNTTGVLTGRKVVAVAAGNSHSLALCSDGTLVAWGLNSSGQLGNNSKADKSSPVGVDSRGVLSGKQVIAISAGANFSLALCSDGSIASWGDNSLGQLGDGSFVDSAVPVLVRSRDLARKQVVALSAGNFHSLALCSDGTAVGWGANESGQLGNGGTANNNFAILVDSSGALAGKRITALSAGGDFSLAVCANGEVAAWGTNESGELANNTKTRRSVPAWIDSSKLGKARAKSINAGFSHGLVVAALPAGAELRSLVVSAGSLSPAFSPEITSYQMKVAAGITTISFTPTARDASTISINGTKVVSGTACVIPLIKGYNKVVIQVAGDLGATRDYEIAILRGTAVIAEFGSAEDVPVATIGTEVSGLTLDVSLGFAPVPGTKLLVHNNPGITPFPGRFANLAQGQLVNIPYGGLTYKFVANYYGGTGNDLVLHWAYQHVFSWVADAYGQLGDEEFSGLGVKYVPIGVTRSGILAGKTVLKVSAGNGQSFALCADGSLAEWGGNVPPTVKSGGALSGKYVVSVSAGGHHSLALCADGTVAAWGSNYAGQLGDGTLVDSNVPVTVDLTGVLAGKTVVAISAGSAYSIVLCSDGTVAAWGDNGYGQLGTGDKTGSNLPVAVNRDGVLAGKTVTAVAAGLYHSLILCSDGKMAAWGSGYVGQLGSGANTISHLPVMVSDTGVLAGKTVIAIAAGPNHNLALCDDQSLVAWGSNTNGALGNNSILDSNIPVATTKAGGLSVKTVSALSAGESSSYALCSDGTLAAWGGNTGGILGDGSVINSPVPVAAISSGLPAGAKILSIESGSSQCLAVVAVPLSNDSKLSGLALNPGTMGFGLSPDVTNYVATVPAATTSITVVPTVRDSLASVMVNGMAVLSGAESGTIPIAAADSVITISVTAEDGTSTSYTVGLRRSESLTAVYHAATDVAVTCPVYDATALTANLTLDFIPTTGASLTLINNTGLNFITGQFTNLAHGQQVDLSFNGLTYRFVANYYGGTGNDLVLEWLRREVDAWGANSSGRLGNGNTATGRVPVNVTQTGLLSGKTVIAVTAGGSHSLALCSDGTLAAWGANYSGQLGNGSLIVSTVPVAVDLTGVLSGKRVVGIAAGESHTLALCSDGTVAAWGSNLDGRLGNGQPTASSVPVAVDRTGILSGKRVTVVAAGGAHSLALCSDGTIAAWGSNSRGQLGDGNRVSMFRRVPVAVNRAGPLSGRIPIAVAAGSSHSLSLDAEGNLTAWGENTSGELGDGTKTDRYVPVAVIRTGVLAGKTVKAMTAGRSHSNSLCSDGTLAAWGLNGSGQLGNGGSTSSSIPMAVTGTGVLSGKVVSAIRAGDSHNLSLCNDGTLAAWGLNSSGQLGDSSITLRRMPVAVDRTGVLAEKVVMAIAAGSAHSLAIAGVPASSQLSGLVLSSGTLSPAFAPGVGTYASNLSAVTGGIKVTPTTRSGFATVKVNGVTVMSGSPSDVVPLSAGSPPIQIEVTGDDGGVTTYSILPPKGITAVYSSATDVPAVFPAYDATGWTVDISLGFSPGPGTNLTVVRNTGIGFITGQFTNLAHGQAVNLSYNGAVYRFVANYYGGSGNDLVLEWAIRSIAAWGYNNYGQLGVASSPNVPTPVAMDDMGILSGKTVVSIAAGLFHSLALCSDGTIATWGGAVRQLGAGGINQSSRPIAVKTTGALAGKTVAGIAAAAGNSLAVCSDGTVVAWGDGSFGQLGNGGNVASNEPVAVPLTGALAGKSVVSVAVGGGHSLAVCTDGSVLAWGWNSLGQLGDGSTTNRNVPVLVSTAGVLAGKQVVAVSAGLQYSLALCSDGTLAAWGDDSERQLGSSAFQGSSSVPRLVDRTGVLAGETVIALSQAAHSTPTVLCASGKVVSWGLNNKGQRGSSGAFPYTPDFVNTTGALAGKSVVSISSGGGSTVAVCSDGKVVTWGDNFYGQLGVTGLGFSVVPLTVTDNGVLTGKKALFAAEAYHSLVVLAEPADGYFGWAFGHSSLTDKTAAGDSDRDGISNLLEYVLHSDPSVSSNAILPTISASGSDFVFSFNRFATSASDSTQVFQFSADMIQWSDVKITTPVDAGVAFGAVDSNGNQSVTVTVPKGAGTRMFGRLQVMRP